MTTQTHDRNGEEIIPITNSFVRETFGWDTMNQVDWNMVEENQKAAQFVLARPSEFPKANFEYLETKAFELELFLLAKPMSMGIRNRNLEAFIMTTTTSPTPEEKPGHTPGPWYYDGNRIHADGPVIIASIWPGNFSAPTEQAIANMRLIANAPAAARELAEMHSKLDYAADVIKKWTLRAVDAEKQRDDLINILAPFIGIWDQGGFGYAERMAKYWGYDNLHAAKAAIAASKEG